MSERANSQRVFVPECCLLQLTSCLFPKDVITVLHALSVAYLRYDRLLLS